MSTSESFMQQFRSIHRALFSVSDKTGILEFARALSERNVELLSTGGDSKIINKKPNTCY